MAHKHSIYDSDPHFVIDSITRTITNKSQKIMLMQYDHNSECFSFEIDRLVEGHDITLCDKVEIHYINSDANKRDYNAGIYEVNDMILDPTNENRVVFTWLVSNNATLYSGTLSFLIMFACTESGEVVYRWNTNIYNGISIARGINNSEEITENYPDILAQWKDELSAIASGAGVIYAGPNEPSSYPYIWLDTSEYLGTNLQNVGYLTIKTGDGIKQRLFPVAKQESIEGLTSKLSQIISTHTSDVKKINDKIQNLMDNFSTEDNNLSDRIDSLETAITGAVTSISHSLTNKGVSVPSSMSINDVAGLIDTIIIETDVPTALQSISITTPPTKTEYNSPNEQIDTTGMVVTADFGDGVTVDITGYSAELRTTYIDDGNGSTEQWYIAWVSITINGVTKETYTALSKVDVIYYASNMSAGDTVLLSEANEVIGYTVADTDYAGAVLLIRDSILTETINFYNTAPTSEYLTRYSGSTLDSYVNNTFYNTLPSKTVSIIKEISVPVRESANSGTSQTYINRKIFVLSAKELGLGGSEYEGSEIEYLNCVNTGDQYWTREVLNGMTNFAYYVKEDGTRSNVQCTVRRGVRPALCVDKTLRMNLSNPGEAHKKWVVYPS